MRMNARIPTRQRDILSLLQIHMICCLLFLSGCATVDPFQNLVEWQEIQTENFIFFTNAEEEDALPLAKKFEVFRAVARKILTIPPFVEKNPIRVYLFKDEDAFSPFRPTEKVAGYFLREHNDIALYVDTFNPISQFSIIYHEYIHYLLSKNSHIIPGWYNEGLATMFETFKFADGALFFGEADRVRWWMMGGRADWIPMDLFLSDRMSYHHQIGYTDAHSQAWALMHYFFYGGDQNFDKLGQYLYHVNNGMHFKGALLSAFGLTPGELLQEVKRYLAQKQLQYSLMWLKDISIDDHYQSRPLKIDQAKQILQDLLDRIEPARYRGSIW